MNFFEFAFQLNLEPNKDLDRYLYFDIYLPLHMLRLVQLRQAQPVKKLSKVRLGFLPNLVVDLILKTLLFL